MRYKNGKQIIEFDNFKEIPEKVDEIEIDDDFKIKDCKNYFITNIGFSNIVGNTEILGYLIGILDKDMNFTIIEYKNKEKREVFKTKFKTIGG